MNTLSRLIQAAPQRFSLARAPIRETTPVRRGSAITAGEAESFFYFQGQITRMLAVVGPSQAANLLDTYMVMYMLHYREPSVPMPLRTPLRHLRIGDLVDDGAHNTWCKETFRFKFEDLPTLMIALDLHPGIHRTATRCTYFNDEGVLMWLFYYAQPGCRLRDLETTFGGSPARTSAVLNHIANRIYFRWSHRIVNSDLRGMEALCEPHYNKLCDKIGGEANLPAHVGRPCALLDDQCQPICRPSDWEYQNQCYSGHKKMHCLKYQILARLDGIIESVHGPIVGRRSDSFVLSDSGLPDRWRDMRQRVWDRDHPNQRIVPLYKVYADGIFAQSDVVGRSHRSPYQGAWQREENRLMSGPREMVEHAINFSINLWRNIDYEKNSRLLQCPIGIGKHYIVGCVMTNAYSCFMGNSASRYFRLPKPDWRYYFR